MSKLLKKLVSSTLLIACTVAVLFTLVIALTPSAAQAESDIRYGNDTSTYQYAPDGDPVQISFDYAGKVEKTYKINSVPKYANQNAELKNTCANVAGANIIAYYTPRFPDLMDGYMPAIKVGNNYIFRGQSSNSQALIEELYRLMGTNPDGTMKGNFYTGMDSYLNSRNYNISYTSQDLQDYSVIEAQLRNSNIFVAFLTSYNFITSYLDNGSNVQFLRTNYTANHMAVIYGYTYTQYYDSDNKKIASAYTLDIIDGLSRDSVKMFIDNQAEAELYLATIQGR